MSKVKVHLPLPCGELVVVSGMFLPPSLNRRFGSVFRLSYGAHYVSLNPHPKPVQVFHLQTSACTVVVVARNVVPLGRENWGSCWARRNRSVFPRRLSSVALPAKSMPRTASCPTLLKRLVD
jgi:hypothetical protein